MKKPSSALSPAHPVPFANVSSFATDDRLRLLVDSVKDYAIFMLDPEGHIVSWNAGAKAIKGYSADEIIGHHVSRFYTPEDLLRGQPAALLAQAIRDGRVEDEGWRVRKDGKAFWADVVITALRDPKTNELVGFAKVTRDLTEKRKAEDELRQSEERFRLLVEGAADYAIFMLDPEGRVMTWNAGAQTIKGYAAHEVIGQHFSIFYPAEDIAMGKCEHELLQATERGRFEDEGWRVRKDGTRVWVNVILTAVRDANGKLIGFSKVTRDLTERTRAEAERLRLVQAQEAVRLRDEFLAIASHELKTPITSMRLHLQAARDRVSADKHAVVKIDRAMRSADRLTALVEALLDVARISSGRFTLNRGESDLATIVHDVVDRYRLAAEHAGCALKTSTSGPLVGHWDPLRIEQVVINLVTNAIKYAAGSEITLALVQREDEAVLEVRDRGPGIPEEELSRIFGRFERAAPLRHFGGLGLGLYVAREIVLAHGGTINASNREGGGAVFTVRLPLPGSGSNA